MVRLPRFRLPIFVAIEQRGPASELRGYLAVDSGKHSFRFLPLLCREYEMVPVLPLTALTKSHLPSSSSLGSTGQACQGQSRAGTDREHRERHAGPGRVHGRRGRRDDRTVHCPQRQGSRPRGRHSVPARVGARGPAAALKIQRTNPYRKWKFEKKIETEKPHFSVFWKSLANRVGFSVTGAFWSDVRGRWLGRGILSASRGLLLFGWITIPLRFNA
jgi:hypothetical protein